VSRTASIPTPTSIVLDGDDAPEPHAVHAYHGLANDDMLYVLTTFVSEPARVIDRYGRRPLRPVEREAACVFWRELGRRIGIHDIPDDFAAMVRFARDYEATHRHPADSNRLVAEGALTALARLLPAPLSDVGRSAVCALLDPPVRRACGLPDAPRPLAWALAHAGAARRRMLAW